MDRQDDARKHALKYVRKKGPAAWRVQLCNRNAHRKAQRVDWVGFDNCIRNSTLQPLPARAIKPPARAARKKVRRLTETAPPGTVSEPGPGERG